MSRSLRIAMLAHSTHPRGGVVHAMQLSEAPAELGHEAVLHAPDSKGTGFSRAPKCESRAFAVAPAPADLLAMIEQRIADYAAHFSRSENRDFDLYHAQDGISGNALTTLKDQGMIGGFVSRRAPFAKRTAAWSSARSGATASARLSPSTRPFCGNGVDADQYRPDPDGGEHHLRRRLGGRAGTRPSLRGRHRSAQEFDAHPRGVRAVARQSPRR